MSLKGKTIVVTRDASQAKPFVDLLNKNQDWVRINQDVIRKGAS